VEVVGLVDSPDHVCARYRLAALARGLAAGGVRLTLKPLPPTPLGRLLLYRELRPADVVIVQRKLLSRVEVAAVRRYAKRLVFDFDDAVWMRDSYRGASPDARRSRRFRAMAAVADLVVAGNGFLAGHAARFARPGRVRLVPTCVDPAAYPAAAHTAIGADVRLTWVGSASTLQGLARAADLLAAVGRGTPGVRLRVVCDRGLTIPSLPVDVVPWAAATEAADLAAADIGVSWIPDDDWSRGKCGLKILQYLAAGLPVVTNPVGVHPEMVTPQTGVLATTAGEWAAAVAALAADPARRRLMGAGGRSVVAGGYGVAAAVRRWLDALGAIGPTRV